LKPPVSLSLFSLKLGKPFFLLLLAGFALSLLPILLILCVLLDELLSAKLHQPLRFSGVRFYFVAGLQRKLAFNTIGLF